MRRCNIEEGNNKLYLLFTDQCESSLKTKLKVTKWYDKACNVQAGIKLLELIRSFVCGVEADLQGTRSVMKADKRLYTFFQRRNTTNDNYLIFLRPIPR